MKNSLLIIIFFLIQQAGYTQNTINIRLSTLEFDKKIRPCLETDIDPEVKQLKKAWSKYLRKNHKIKMEGMGLLSNRDLLFAKKVVVAKISPNQLDFYTRITERKEGSSMQVFAAFGYDDYVGPETHPAEHAAMHSIVNEFLLQFLIDYYKKEISAVSSRMKNLKREKKKLLSEISRNNKTVRNNSSDMSRINSSEKKTPEEVKSAQEKIDKFLKENRMMEERNSEAQSNIKTIEEKIVFRTEKLNKLVEKQKRIVK